MSSGKSSIVGRVSEPAGAFPRASSGRGQASLGTGCGEIEPTSGLEPLTCSHYELASASYAPLLATVLALGLGAPPRPLLGWMVASIALWGAAITGAAALGLSMFSG